MHRRTPVLLTAGSLVVLSAVAATGVATNAATATQRHAVRGSTSVALFGLPGGDFQGVKGVSGTRAHKTTLFDVNRASAQATAINPVGGNDGLLCGDDGFVLPVRGLRKAPRLQHPRIDGRRFRAEGGSTYDFFCQGAAVHGSFALASGDSQGLLQLIRKHGTWKVDKRVHSPGHNDAGKPHRKGWIDFRDSTTSSTLFNNVVIAPRPQANGKYLAVALDRGEGTAVVVEGVGTAKPRVRGALTSDALSNTTVGDGQGAVAFLPGTSSRAVIATHSGVAVLGLHKPGKPRLRVRTTVGDGMVEPGSLTVSRDGDHLAVAVGGTVYGYSHVLAAVAHGRKLKLQTSFTLDPSVTALVTDVAYTRNGTLAVLHGDPAVLPVVWHLTLVKKVPAGRHFIKGSIDTGKPDLSGSLSVWPAP